jgi:CHASE3 domain sensor protein
MTLETRLDQLSTSLRGFAQLVQGMSTELKDRAETARRLRQEAEDAEALAAQHQDQIDALRRLLRKEMSTELKSTERHILRDSMKIAITSFVLGAAVSILITLLVHPVH